MIRSGTVTSGSERVAQLEDPGVHDREQVEVRQVAGRAGGVPVAGLTVVLHAHRDAVVAADVAAVLQAERPGVELAEPVVGRGVVGQRGAVEQPAGVEVGGRLAVEAQVGLQVAVGRPARRGRAARRCARRCPSRRS